MMPVMEKTPELVAIEYLPHWTDEKNKFESVPAIDTGCTCSKQHMSVHEAMCSHCWTRFLERNGNKKSAI